MTRVRLFKAGYFAWAIVPAALYAMTPQGTAHVIWSYAFRGSYADPRSRTYTRCTYVSFSGTLTEYPADGKCGWLRFAKPSGRFE